MNLLKELIVIKLGGSVLQNLHPSFFTQCTQLIEQNKSLIIVHGGGPFISQQMNNMGKTPRFVEGRRITDKATLDVVQMVLAGSVNKQLVNQFHSAGLSTIGLSGIDLQILQVKQSDPEIGYVGEIVNINKESIDQMLSLGWTPVIASLGIDDSGQIFNVNADEAAAAIAEAIGAKQLILVSDVDGIYIQEGTTKKVLNQATPSLIEDYIQKGHISGGMIPKVRSGIQCLQGGIEKVQIINGAKPTISIPNSPTGTYLVKERVTK